MGDSGFEACGIENAIAGSVEGCGSAQAVPYRMCQCCRISDQLPSLRIEALHQKVPVSQKQNVSGSGIHNFGIRLEQGRMFRRIQRTNLSTTRLRGRTVSAKIKERRPT